MSLRKYYHTLDRPNAGFFYLNLFQGFERELFMDPDDVPVMSLFGVKGKSYAVEVGMKEILDGHDPMEVINGPETRTMFLEGRPSEAMYQLLDAHGTIDGQTPVTLGFNSSPNTLRQPFGCSKPETTEERSRKDIEHLKSVFRDHAQNSKGVFHGGMVFVTSVFFQNEDDIWLQAQLNRARTDKGFWNKTHAIEISSSKLLESERFHDALAQAAQWEVSEDQYFSL